MELGMTLLDWLWSRLLYFLHWRISTKPYDCFLSSSVAQPNSPARRGLISEGSNGAE